MQFSSTSSRRSKWSEWSPATSLSPFSLLIFLELSLFIVPAKPSASE